MNHTRSYSAIAAKSALVVLLLTTSFCGKNSVNTAGNNNDTNSTNDTNNVPVNGIALTDIDGNGYHSITLGGQTWTVENLKSTRYNDGTPIPQVTDDKAWDTLGKHSGAGYCWYNNDIANKDKYGALYNWFAIESKKLAPAGWHIPTEAERTTLTNHLIAGGYNWDSTTAGNKIAKSLAAKTEWAATTGSGAIGNDLTKNNASGFSAFPGGYRGIYGVCFDIGYTARWWSAPVADKNYVNAPQLLWESDTLATTWNTQRGGYSVRLVKN
jgi:uncharacterized protein (TIGR02145 family)